ncbi:MAG: hypothetical protein JXB35_09445 [Anaerolineae bacterium]|nr:hypothetical protein [Anaerolineae bacterium]
MDFERPDLSGVSADVVAYIEALEAALAAAGDKGRPSPAQPPAEEPPEPSEPPTTRNVITLSAAGWVKRTPRHEYGRQRRGGMGVFDLDLPEGDAPAVLSVLDEEETALVVTSQGRAFRLPVRDIPEGPVRGRGKPLATWLPLREGERVVALLPADNGAQMALVSARGRVRRVRASFLGVHMIPGMRFHDVKDGGDVVGACWTSGNDDLFVVARSGQAIRFPEQRVHDSGSLGINLDRGDVAVAITAVNEKSGVFLVGRDGKGTIRLMEGFRSNKSPGGGGKVAMNTEHLVAAFTIAFVDPVDPTDSTDPTDPTEPSDDVLVISSLSKLIRFSASDVPAKTGVVQGVNCIALRNDETVAAAPGRCTG